MSPSDFDLPLWRGDGDGDGDDDDDGPEVRLMHHDPRWRQEFEQTRSGIYQYCRGAVTRVEHVGSTALPGLIARPIIDIVAAAQGIDDLAAATTAIEGMNFRIVETPGWAGPVTTLQKPRHGSPTHRVMLTTLADPLADRTVRLREVLRGDRELALRFEETKVARWRRGGGNAAKYALDKAVFFAHLEEQMEP